MVERKYYTPSEAAQVAKIPESDIIHFIETNQLPVYLLSGRRQYVVATSDGGGDLVARGTVWFGGLLSVHHTWIKSLLEHGEITLNKWGRLVHANDFQHYSPHLPYKSGSLPEALDSWQPTEWKQLAPESLRLLPFPEEMPNGWHSLNKMLDTIQKAQGIAPTGDSEELNIPEYKFDFNKNGKFELKDLRILTSDLNKLVHPKSSEDTASKNSEKEIKLSWCERKKHPIKIDKVIERLFLFNLDKSGPQLWQLLMVDTESDAPEYDLEGVILEIDAKSLDWETSKDTTRPLSRKSFLNKISDLKKFYGN